MEVNATDLLNTSFGWLLLRSNLDFIIVRENEADIFSIRKPTIHFDNSLPVSATNPYIITFEPA